MPSSHHTGYGVDFHPASFIIIPPGILAGSAVRWIGARLPPLARHCLHCLPKRRSAAQAGELRAVAPRTHANATAGTPMTTFRQLLAQFDESAKTLAVKGRHFEEFCEAFFQLGQAPGYDFDEVWAWNDWSGRNGLTDTGIDLVARERGSGNLVAIQCKFYSPQASLSWTNVATFVGMLGQPEFSSGLIVSTAGTESSNLHANIQRNEKPVRVWRVEDFEDSAVDWDQFRIDRPAQLALRDPKQTRAHQEEALTDVMREFETHDRGQMIMACGTGKTFTSLQLAERLVGAGGSVLFLVPSISLLSAAVKSWASDASLRLATFAVCSDVHAARRTRGEDMSPNDLAFPASTDAAALLERIAEQPSGAGAMTVVFSTYQSIDVITEAQAQGLGEFHLVICDEAHRTTGAFKETDDQSTFTKVHDNTFVQARRRLYMTATPRVYGDQTKAKAADNDVVLASMDDTEPSALCSMSWALGKRSNVNCSRITGSSSWP